MFNQYWPVMKGEQIGEILIALHSPRLEMNIGYAMLAIEHSGLGTSMTVESPVGALAATVVEMPFVKPVKT